MAKNDSSSTAAAGSSGNAVSGGTELADLRHENGEVIISQERHKVTVEAASEIEAICIAFHQYMRADVGGDHSVARGLTARIKELACTVMAGLIDEDHSTSDLEQTVYCCGGAEC